jgi:hypothetical protein
VSDSSTGATRGRTIDELAILRLRCGDGEHEGHEGELGTVCNTGSCARASGRDRDGPELERFIRGPTGVIARAMTAAQRWTTVLERVPPAALVAGLSLVTVVFVLVATSRGPGITPDSVGYVAAARSLVATGELLYWDGGPFVLWPPLMPLLLGLGLRAGIDPQVTAVLLNCSAGVTSVMLTWLIAKRLLPSGILPVLPAAAVALSLATLRNNQMLWSEPLFAALALAALYTLVRIQEDGPRHVNVAVLVTLVSLAGTTRFLGLFLIPLAAIGVWLAALPSGRGRALVLGALAGVLSATGSVAVVLRNLSLDVGHFGPRGTSTDTLLSALVGTLKTVGHYVIPFVPEPIAVVLGLLLGAVAAAGAVLVLLKRRSDPRIMLLLLMFIGGYVTLLVMSLLSTAVDPVNARYLSPMVAPLAILGVVGGVSLAGSFSDRRGLPNRTKRARVLRGALVGLAAIFLAVNVVADIRQAVISARLGVGYNRADVLSSPLAAAVTALPREATVTSNDPIAVYWVSGRSPVSGRWVLLRHGGLDRLRSELAAGTSVYYAWFLDQRTAQGVAPEELERAGLTLSELARYADGTLFELQEAAGATAP